MELPLYQINTFTTHYQGGNPAGVCPLNEWLPDAVMQSIACENGFSETAFFVKGEYMFDLRWFTPTCEVDLCGQATLASAFALRDVMNDVREYYDFNTRSGAIRVLNQSPLLVLDMPALAVESVSISTEMSHALGVEITAQYSGMDDLVVLNSNAMVKAVTPDLTLLKKLGTGGRGVIVTAIGDEVIPP